MSPSNINSFVGDLVQMAQAMEQLPKVEQELDLTRHQLDRVQQDVQDRELAIVNYKREIEELHAKVRSLEVERDDASFRVLEAEDIAHSVLTLVRTVSVDLALIEQKLSPPKPEPVKEPESQGSSEPNPTKTATDGEPKSEQTSVTSSVSEAATSVSDAVHSISEVSSGQSESSPTVTSETTQPQSVPTPNAETPTPASTEPTHGQYFGKRYKDVEGYVSYHDWISGGGTGSDYYSSKSPY